VRTTDAGGLFFEQAFTISITNVNEMPSFTKGANQRYPYLTSGLQTVSGWATAINDGDSTVTQALTFNVMRDESRHVSFGHVFLGPVIRKLDEASREDLADFAFNAIYLIAQGTQMGGGQTLASRADPGFLEVLKNSEIDPDDFFKGMQEAADDGIMTQLPAGQIHSLDDLMLPAIARVGLIEGVVWRKRVTALGCQKKAFLRTRTVGKRLSKGFQVIIRQIIILHTKMAFRIHEIHLFG
jgi:hypothetical protein